MVELVDTQASEACDRKIMEVQVLFRPPELCHKRMNIQSIKTNKITARKKSVFDILDEFLMEMVEGSILAVTSKIVSICEGNIVDTKGVDKKDLIAGESDYWLPPSMSKYDFSLTIRDGVLLPTAGIDESNGEGYYILWPKEPQKTANEIREYLIKRFGLNRVGVIITDSKTTPLRWGTTGVCVAHSGFDALNDYIGKLDIFGREMLATKANIADALAVSAVLVMGEGSEQTPLAIIDDVNFVEFQGRNPSEQELLALKISIEDDLYAPILNSVKWKKGERVR